MSQLYFRTGFLERAGHSCFFLVCAASGPPRWGGLTPQSPPAWAHTSPGYLATVPRRGSERGRGLRRCISNKLPGDARAGSAGRPAWNQMQGTQGDGRLVPGATASPGRRWTALRAGSQSCLFFHLGAGRGGAVNQERWDIWVEGWDGARGDRPSSAVRLSHGFLPSAQLPKLLNLSDSL